MRSGASCSASAPISSAFDFLTFGLLLYVFHAGVELFRTGWFVESLLTELAIVLVLRTSRPLHRSRPGRWLAASTGAVAALAVALPYLPLTTYFGFEPLPVQLLATLIAVTVGYAACSELAKRRAYGRTSLMATPRRVAAHSRR